MNLGSCIFYFTVRIRFGFVKFLNLRVRVWLGWVKNQGLGFCSGSVLDPNPGSKYEYSCECEHDTRRLALDAQLHIRYPHFIRTLVTALFSPLIVHQQITFSLFLRPNLEALQSYSIVSFLVLFSVFRLWRIFVFVLQPVLNGIYAVILYPTTSNCTITVYSVQY